jgi:hypothetical protein
MTDEHIEKTKSAVESAENIPADKKAELLDLLSKLKSAIAKVSQTHNEDAQRIARLWKPRPRKRFAPRKNRNRPRDFRTNLNNPWKSLKRRIRNSSRL